MIRPFHASAGFSLTTLTPSIPQFADKIDFTR
jgi:hypothetical protein